MKPWHMVYLEYRYCSVKAPLIPPRIARGTGKWFNHDGEARYRIPGTRLVGAIYKFPACMATEAEIEALKDLPQEEW
jgi:hypothetical protein